MDDEARETLCGVYVSPFGVHSGSFRCGLPVGHEGGHMPRADLLALMPAEIRRFYEDRSPARPPQGTEETK